jgi:hypothetical protein
MGGDPKGGLLNYLTVDTDKTVLDELFGLPP